MVLVEAPLWEVGNVWNPWLRQCSFALVLCRYPAASDTPEHSCGALKPVYLSCPTGNMGTMDGDCPGGSAQQAIQVLVPLRDAGMAARDG